jgi:hypothetical protein
MPDQGARPLAGHLLAGSRDTANGTAIALRPAEVKLARGTMQAVAELRIAPRGLVK